MNFVGNIFKICHDCIKGNYVNLTKLSKMAAENRDWSTCFACRGNMHAGQFDQMGRICFCQNCVLAKECLCDVCNTLKGTLETEVNFTLIHQRHQTW